jgi:glyoxylase-like metal-dependent hydrolase (beta-lactamase superfamily II)
MAKLPTADTMRFNQRFPRVQFELLKVGSCRQLERIARNRGPWRTIEFPALVGLLKHPTRGYLLFDTGYSEYFCAATRSLPESLYRIATPHSLPPDEVLLSQLKARGITPSQIGTIICSHFHADHVAGLKDFPTARFIASEVECKRLCAKGRISQIRQAFLKDLLPGDFIKRTHWVEAMEKVATGLPNLEEGYDLLGDGSVLGIPLPGHSPAQFGILFATPSGRQTFLVADACWQSRALEENQLPSALAYSLFDDRKAYNQTFARLVALYHAPDRPVMIPSHCLSAWRENQLADV